MTSIAWMPGVMFTIFESVATYAVFSTEEARPNMRA
jgi:hypothetical protein